MPSFDVVLEPNLVELRNAVEQCNKELGTRFDFKGSDSRVEIAGTDKKRELTLYADNEFQLKQLTDVLLARLAKRGVDVRFLALEAKPEKMSHDKLKHTVGVKAGVDSDTGRKIQRLLKDSKLKVQAAIQGDTVRVTGTKRDDLQTAIALLRKDVADVPVSFTNFRD